MANTAVSSSLGFVAWEAEDSFADAADDTYTTVIQTRDDMIDLSGLQRPLLEPGGVYQRHNESDLYRLGAFGVGTFSVTLDLAGHGSTCTGSLTEPNLAKLLAHVFGNSNWTQVGDTSLTTASSTTTVLGGDGGTKLVGGIVRAGVTADGRADGQAGVVASVGGGNTTLLTAIPVAVADGDDCFAMGMIYPVSASGSGDIITSSGATYSNTLRFVLCSGNLAYVARGCVCATQPELIGLNPGEIPQIKLTFSTVAWNPISVTFPSATAIDDKTPTVNANGSVFINTVGTSTRATVAPLEMSITLGHSIVPVMGPNGATTGQNVVGWRRVPAPTTLSLTIEAEAQTASPAYWLTANPTAARHILITGNTVDGASWAMYFPRAIQTNNPTQGSTNGLNTRTIEFRCATGATTTSELTLSAWRLGLA